MTDEDALDHQVFAIGRHGVGGHQPAALAQAVGEVVEREGRGRGVLQLPAQAGDSAVAVIDDPERSEAAIFSGEIAAQFAAHSVWISR
jgi:hypothetical protein